MDCYDIWADILNKFFQLTPWVQVSFCLGMGTTTLGMAYFVKEVVATLMSPFQKRELMKAPPFTD